MEARYPGVRFLPRLRWYSSFYILYLYMAMLQVQYAQSAVGLGNRYRWLNDALQNLFGGWCLGVFAMLLIMFPFFRVPRTQTNPLCSAATLRWPFSPLSATTSINARWNVSVCGLGAFCFVHILARVRCQCQSCERPPEPAVCRAGERKKARRTGWMSTRRRLYEISVGADRVLQFNRWCGLCDKFWSCRDDGRFDLVNTKVQQSCDLKICYKKRSNHDQIIQFWIYNRDFLEHNYRSQYVWFT